MNLKIDLARAGFMFAAAGIIFTANVVPANAKVISDCGFSGITKYQDSYYNAKKLQTKAKVKAAKKQTVTAKEVSEFENVGISIASNYVNIRKYKQKGK